MRSQVSEKPKKKFSSFSEKPKKFFGKTERKVISSSEKPKVFSEKPQTNIIYITYKIIHIIIQGEELAKVIVLNEYELSNGTIEMIAQDLECPIKVDFNNYEECINEIVNWIKKETIDNMK